RRRWSVGRPDGFFLGADGSVSARARFSPRYQAGRRRQCCDRDDRAAYRETYPNSRTRVLKAGFVGRRKEMHALRRDLRQGRHRPVVRGQGGFGKSFFCTEALKVYDRLGWQPFGVWCIDVEGCGKSGGRIGFPDRNRRRCSLRGQMARCAGCIQQAASQDERLRESSGHLLFLLQGLLAAQSRNLVLYLDNLESLQTGPREGEGGDFAEWRDSECAALWKGLLRIQRE